MKYRIIGNILPAVEVMFEQIGEEMITQSGGMSWMSDGISMSTDTNGGALAGLGRAFAGESIFMNHYKAEKVNSTITFASTVPGKIVPVKMKEHINGIVCQKGAFLCSDSSVVLSVEFTKKLSSGMFGGEGFILERLLGSGVAFLEVDGDPVEKILSAGEILKVDTGNVVAFDSNISYEIELVRGIKNMILGGEGLFLTKLTGPGKVILQTQNLSKFGSSYSNSLIR